MSHYQARPTASQIRDGYFICPRKLHREWKDRFPFHEYDALAFGKQYTRLRLDQNYRVRVALKGHIVPGETIIVTVDGKRLVIEKGH